VIESTQPKKKVKVLQFYRTYFPDTQGGAEEVIRQIALNVSDCVDMRVCALSPGIDQPEEVEMYGITVLRIPQCFELASCGFAWKGIAQFVAACKWADVIHYHYPWPFADLLDLLFVRRLGKKRMVTYHSDIVRQQGLLQLYSPLQHSFLGSIDSIVATSPPYAQTSSELQRYKSKVSVIPLGINPNSYPDVDIAVSDKWSALLGRGFFLFVGVLRYYKGLDVLLEAAAQVRHVKVVIVGAGPEGERLRKKAKQLRLDNVVFTGRIDDQDKICLLQLCGACVLPSHQRSEAFGVSLLEGAMYAKALISAEIGTGTTFVNKHEETGLVVEPDSPESMALALERLSDSDFAREMGAGALKRFKALFSGAGMGRSYEEHYIELGSGS